MVLRANSAAATAPADTSPTTVTPVGAFEPMDEDTTSTPAANDAPAASPAPAPAAAQPAPAPAPAAAPAAAPPAPASDSRELKTQQGGAVIVSQANEAGKFAAQVAEMKGAVDFAFGNFRVFKGVNGEIATTDGSAKFGRWVRGTMAAWDDHWEVSPGSKSDKSKEAVAYSKDGQTIDSVVNSDKYGEWIGKSPAAYAKWLSEEGDYPEAKVSRYIDVAIVVLEADNGEDEFIGEIVQITLSQSSIPSFSSYQEKLKTKATLLKRGVAGIKLPEDPFTLFFLREAVSKNGNNWTKINVMDKLPQKF